jgi:hypothetical protein
MQRLGSPAVSLHSIIHPLEATQYITHVVLATRRKSALM